MRPKKNKSFGSYRSLEISLCMDSDIELDLVTTQTPLNVVPSSNARGDVRMLKPRVHLVTVCAIPLSIFSHFKTLDWYNSFTEDYPPMSCDFAWECKCFVYVYSIIQRVKKSWIYFQVFTQIAYHDTGEYISTGTKRLTRRALMVVRRAPLCKRKV